MACVCVVWSDFCWPFLHSRDVQVLEGGQWSTNNLLSNAYSPFQFPSVQFGSWTKPDSCTNVHRRDSKMAENCTSSSCSRFSHRLLWKNPNLSYACQFWMHQMVRAQKVGSPWVSRLRLRPLLHSAPLNCVEIVIFKISLYICCIYQTLYKLYVVVHALSKTLVLILFVIHSSTYRCLLTTWKQVVWLWKGRERGWGWHRLSHLNYSFSRPHTEVLILLFVYSNKCCGL